MKIKPQDMYHYYYNYAAWRAIDDYNRSQIQAGDTDKVVRISQAKEIVGNLFTQLNARQTQTGQLVRPDAFFAAFSDAIAPAFGGEKPYPDANAIRSVFRDTFNEFKAMTNFDPNNRTQDGEYVLDGQHSYLPISPYDSRFADLGSVINYGSQLDAVSVATDRDVSEISTIHGAMKTPFYHNLHMSETTGDYVAYQAANDTLYTIDDYSGLSKLRPWMKDEEYRKVRDHVNANIDLDHITSDQVVAYRRMSNKAAYILRGLRSEGYTYTITPETQLGQIKATVDGTKLNIRLTDKPENADYVGRIYDAGVQGYFNSSRRNAENKYSYDSTPAEALDLVNFALGRPVNTRGYRKNWQVGLDGPAHRMIAGRNTKTHITYHSNGNLSTIYKPLLTPKGKADPFNNVVKMYFNARGRTNSTTPMKDGDAANTYLQNSVKSARENFADRINVQNLIDESHKVDTALANGDTTDPHAVDGYMPTLDNDPLINSIQQDIWDVLRTKEDENGRAVLLKPGKTQDELSEYLAENPDGVDPQDLAQYQYDLNMSPEDMATAYASDNVDYFVGQFDQNTDGKRFDPNNVVNYQTSSYGIYRNRDDMVKALKMAKIPADQLKGTDDSLENIKNNLVTFDPSTSQKMRDIETPFMRTMYNTIHNSLSANGLTFDDNDILIDQNGIVQYKGHFADSERYIDKDGKELPPKEITGTIGQIFEPKQDGIDKGTVYTNFAGDNNYAFVPGYTAEILPQKPGESKTYEERTILTGYEQQMVKNLRYQIRKDLLLPEKETQAGSSTSVNNTYRQVNADHKEPDFVAQYQEQGMPDHIIEAVIRSEGEKVRYSNEIRDNSTINADYQAKKRGYDYANDNSMDAYNLTGNKNMSILDTDGDGYFDPIASNATTTNQGIAKFLADGAKVDAEGHIIPGPKEGPGSRMALMNLPEAEFMKFDTFDRQNMTISNWLQANSVMPQVHVAQMTFGGWNQDDGIVVSKEFAEKAMVRGADGKMRQMRKGDKILDCHGNKGVVSLIVDRNMDLEKAKKLGIEKEVKFYKNNPSLDVVMAPFPAVSRYNGGTARELMQHPQDLVGLDGQPIKGAMGTMTMIVTDKAVDKKSKVYDDEAIREGKGRKVSAQLAWTLNSKGAKAIMHEAFGRNDSAMSNLKEYLNVMGMDITSVGALRPTLTKTTLRERSQIEMPDIVYKGKVGKVDYQATEKNLGETLNKQGGLMQLPFEIELANGQKTDNVPVLSSYLRSGQELQDGSLIVHDYTHQYEQMYRQGIRYTASQKLIKDLSAKDTLTSREQTRLKRAKDAVKDSQEKAQEAYNNVAGDIKSRIFEGKHNIFKDKLMAHKMPHSATKVWTENPTLDIDQIEMGEDTAKELGVKEGDQVVVWRDPALRDGSTRSMIVKFSDDPHQTNVSIPPAMDKPFDGDFDGDSVGIVALKTPQAKREAQEKFAVKNNLLDYGAGKDENGDYPLYMQHSLDIMVAEYKHPELKKQWQDIQHDVNDFESKYKKGEITKGSLDIARQHAVKRISQYYRDCYKDGYGANIKYNNLADHLQSVKEACLDTGAKGNAKKFIDYTIYLGAKVAQDKEGHLDLNNVQDAGKPLSTREMQQATMMATAIKSFGTGVAGAFSQRGMRALRNVSPKAILELTYPVTQSVLQVKHDPDEAVKKYDMLMGPVRDLWRGYSMTKTNDGTWQVRRDENNKPIPASQQEWEKTFYQMYTEDLDVTPNKDYIHEVANALSNNVNHVMSSVEDAPTMSTMDKLAYGGTFEDLKEAAQNGENLFKGVNNVQFASQKLIDNVQTIKNRRLEKQEQNEKIAQGKPVTFTPHDDKEIKRFGKSDTRDNRTAMQHRESHLVRENVQPSTDQSLADSVPKTPTEQQAPTEPENDGKTAESGYNIV